MRYPTPRALLLGAMLLASTVAHAQYAWIDPKGVRQFSDQPPPPGTPAANILKTPRGVPVPADAPPAAAAKPASPTPSWTDREADYRKRMAKAQETEQKTATESGKADAKRANCAAAARNKETIESGRRLRTEQNAVMTEEEKARDLAQYAKTLKDCS